eukprot:TRINITY_DN7896_c0_g3_i4.p1 TRINITY_DN7896_c0_g3~~TRINITY_DN7896_c0_g3_i4.p1  ORF type:complete len:202 (-),score=15.96 TRINITY_DN7896_c0_g3_i4:389-994(-)
MYANQSSIIKVGTLFPIFLPFVMSFGLQWIFFCQITLRYWSDNAVLDGLATLIFYVTANAALASLIMCTCTDPGAVRKDWSNANLSHASFVSKRHREAFGELYPSVELNENSFPKYEFCFICKIVVPPKTEHCDFCNKCTLNLDHHCPWVANCIGFRNQKLFVLFCGYAGLSCTLLGLALLPQAYEIFQDESDLVFVYLLE